MTNKWPDIKPAKIIRTARDMIGVAAVTQPEHRSEFWYVATMGPSGGWVTRSVVRVNTRNGQTLEGEVLAWADQALAR